MRPRADQDTASGGFTLIEAVVAVAIVAILAGMAAPLLVKSLDQERTAATRTSLQNAWQQLFGTPNARVYNMQADFGFTAPANTLTDLGKMVQRTAPFTANPPAWGLNGAAFMNGWNGPYWNGSLVTVAGRQVPADGWGRPIELIYNAGTWQLHSAGPDGVINTADDIVYPAAPVNLNATAVATIFISVNSSRTVATPAGQVTYVDRAAGAVRSRNQALAAVGILGTIPPVTLTVNPGPVNITLSYPAAAPYSQLNNSQIVDLLPGQTLTLPVALN